MDNPESKDSWLLDLDTDRPRINPVHVKLCRIAVKGISPTDASQLLSLNIINQGWIDVFYENLKELESLGVVLTTASGNDGKNSITGYPASFGKLRGDKRIDSLMVICALNA
ncbi:hypothetical protein K469DRAFT_696625 [Zopfia rhizophila CBS 207.26]|uniref:Uncharacterized protein n=1 Tax=Zopfia rhizophila CBS 207.26 TaxID=1314779 RepID=A0A6A6DDC3_9PEZI|nr:hypothetical protein K469DRAFT_696625 [Zopfia rhizophila CBS 207.26]